MAKIQVIVCKCGSKMAACLEPYCYTDKDWHRDIKKYLDKGCSVEMIESGKGLSLAKCKCNEQGKQLSLF